MLKACISWQRLSEAKVIVLPTTGSPPLSKKTLPMVKARNDNAPIKQPSMAMLKIIPSAKRLFFASFGLRSIMS